MSARVHAHTKARVAVRAAASFFPSIFDAGIPALSYRAKRADASADFDGKTCSGGKGPYRNSVSLCSSHLASYRAASRREYRKRAYPGLSRRDCPLGKYNFHRFLVIVQRNFTSTQLTRLMGLAVHFPFPSASGRFPESLDRTDRNDIAVPANRLLPPFLPYAGRRACFLEVSAQTSSFHEQARRDSNYLVEPDEGNDGTFLTGIRRKSYGRKLRIIPALEKYGGPVLFRANTRTRVFRHACNRVCVCARACRRDVGKERGAGGSVECTFEVVGEMRLLLARRMWLR